MCKYFLYSCNCLWVTQCHVCILLKESIFFFICILNLIFFSLVCVFLFFPTPFIFPQNLFCFSYFYGGRNFFFNLCGSQGSCCSSQGELSLFSLTLLRMFSVYHLIRQSLSIHDKKGEIQMKCENMCESCLFCLGGDTLIVYDSGKYKYVWQI